MKISVIIPSYNRYELLKRALASVFAQTYSPYEVIVVDDGSDDATSHIQNDFPNIKYIYQKNSGVSMARNCGIKSARGEWIAFLDSDDAWHREKLQYQHSFHKKNPDILMSYTDEVWIRDGVEVKIPKKFSKIGQDAFAENLSYCNLAPSSVLMHKSLFSQVGLFDGELEVCEDYDLWLRVALHHKIGLIEKKLLYKYAGHKNQLSLKHWGMDRFRVISLEKIFDDADDAQKKLIKEELVKKYTLLKKGALKYDKISDIKFYEEKLQLYYKGNS